MIGQLRGRVDAVGEDWVLVDVGGVGYEVFCPSRVLAALPGQGEAVSLAIETHVREDAIKLFGFASPGEREWFRLLMTVQGVGAKVALAVLGVLDSDGLGNAILTEDKASVQRAPGVGKRVAERIVSELKSKVPGMGLATSLPGPTATGSTGPTGAAADATSALVNLGYSEVQIRPVIARLVASDAAEDVGSLIRKALRELAG